MTLTAAIIVAAGRGSRAGGETPKQWRLLNTGPKAVRVIDLAIAAFRDRVDRIVVVHHPDDRNRLQSLENVTLTPGGDSRSASVLNGLKSLEGQGVAQVLIHDAARALVPGHVIDNVLDALKTHDGAAPALAITDAL